MAKTISILGVTDSVGTQAADVAVCPENAMDAVKEIANYTLCHCKDGLIADVIEKIEAGEIA